ncbi:MAG: N-acetylmuramoyl-L-alanine amidase family protein [Christensenellaceae bacterium]|jgi:N-acetylmuramoyl-L-alanine amidase
MARRMDRGSRQTRKIPGDTNGNGGKAFLLVMLLLLVMVVGYFVFKPKGAEGPLQNRKEMLAAPTQIDEEGIVIVVDAGHGGFDNGTKGAFTGVLEKDINLEIAFYLKLELEEKGYQVVMTRMDEDAIGPDKNADMAKRKQIMAEPYVNLIVLIHQNFFEGDEGIYGPQTYHAPGAVQGELLAKDILVELNEQLGIENPRPVRSLTENNMLITAAVHPAALVECGFLSNKKEEALLSSSDYQKKVAKAIADGVETYVNTYIEV